MTPAIARPRSGHLPALTGFRFFLAMWVIVDHMVGKGHALEPIALMLPDPLQAIMRAGYMAVPTFFVLSGFVLARTYACTQWSGRNLWKYLVGRVARVYPVYLLSLLIVSPFIWKAKDQPKGWLVAMHLTLMQGWWVGHYTAGWNIAAWTLSCEMFFYLMFPLLIILLKDSGWVRTLGTALLACVLTRVMWAFGVSDNLKPIVHLADFLMGIAVSNAFDLLTNNGKAPTGKWLYAVGFLGSGALIGYAKYLPNSIDLNTLLRPMNAVLLLGLGLGGGWIARFLSRGSIVYLGKSSYAMYILHIPILWWAVTWPGNAAPYFYMLLVIGASCVVYAKFEEPANRYIRSMVGKPKAAPQLETLRPHEAIES